MSYPYSVDLIIFDFDGTLADTREDLAASVNYALRELFLPQLPVDVIIGFVGEGITPLLERILGPERLHLVEEAVALYTKHHRDHLLDKTCLYPGVPEVLEHFRGKKKAIISNKSCEFTARIAEGLRIADHFALILGGDSTSHRKPHPEPVEKVLEALGVTRKRTVMVGDSPLDVLAGKRAGLLTSAVTYGFRTREELMKAGPDLLLDDLRELTRYLG
ncbi:MAG: HAD-IA family hydrolase [candidate division NC10 bacterium]|nr:HAD-IA family hydrolase [candidate division NC10 bacterium]